MNTPRAKKIPTYTFEVDFTQMVETVQIIDAVGQAFSREEVRNAIVTQIGNEYSSYMGREAIKKAETIAHAFTWEEIFEQGSQTFSVNISKNSKPLIKPEWRKAGISKRSGDALLRIKSLENNQAALRDPRVMRLAKNPSNITEHHFKDQFPELETVNIIEKMSSIPSRRAISSSGSSWRMEQGRSRSGDPVSYNKNRRRIVGISEDGNKLTNFANIRRKNPYQNTFSNFFLDFWSDVDRRPDSRAMVDRINRQTIREITKLSEEEKTKYMASRIKAGVQMDIKDRRVSVTPTARVRMIAVVNGRPIVSPGQMNLRASSNQVEKFKNAIIKGVKTIKNDVDYRVG